MRRQKKASESLAQLRRIRNDGASRLSALDTAQEAQMVYDEVTEEEFNAIQKKRIQEDDFIVDDDGRGYADYGDDMGGDGSSGEDSEADEETFGRKNKKSKQKKAHKDARVSTFFNKQAAKFAATSASATEDDVGKPAPRVVQKKKDMPAVNEEALMNDIFKDLDAAEEVDPMFTVTESSEPSTGESLFKYDGIVGDFQTSRRNDIFANSFQLSDNEEEDEIILDDILPVDEDMTQAPVDDFDYEANLSDADVIPKEEKMLPTGKTSLEAPTLTGANLLDDVNAKQEAPSPPSLDSSKPQLATSGVTIRSFEADPAKSVKRVSAAQFVPKFATQAPAVASTSAGPKNETVTPAGYTSWTSVMDSLAVGDTTATQQNGAGAGTSSSMLSGSANEADYFEEDGSLFAYWFDAYEKDGIVYVFAKVFNKTDSRFVSCCITVQNMSRVLFVLPRLQRKQAGNDTDLDVTMKDVFDEIDHVLSNHGVKEKRSCAVTRKYAFEIPGVPVESDYLKVAYSYKYPAIPMDTSGVNFSHVFGSNASALENFIIKRKLMGPCWIQIQQPKISRTNPISWTKLEILVEGPKMVKAVTESQMEEISRLKSPPPFTAMSISLRTVMNHQKNTNEIVAACAMVYNNVSIDGTSPPSAPLSYSAIRPLTGVPMPAGFDELIATAKKSGRAIERLPNEKGLLNYLIAQIHRADPDIIVGHNFIGVDLDILLHRLKANKSDGWSKLGRLRRTKWPKLQAGAGGAGDTTFQERTVASGRILCDTFMSAKDYVMKAKSYTLTNMALTQLKIVRQELDLDKIPQLFWDAQQLFWLLKHCETDCVLSASLMMKLQVLPLTKQLTGLAGNLWSRTIMAGSRADRNEYLLLHEFHNKKFIVPDKSVRQKAQVVDFQKDDDDDGFGGGIAPRANTSTRRKPAYAGGLVLEPKKGLYEKFVLMLDFNSLYPSIIQEFNICFTTVERPADMDDDTVPTPPDSSVPQGILPKLLATLVERRRAVKSLMKSPKLSEAEYSELNIRQQALKLTANSMYGCLGFTHSRFYAKPLAMLVTSRGREILQNTVDLATSEKLDVIYGDTDSIMIHTNTDTLKDVIKCGNDFKRAVNKRYRLLEIEIDGIFKKMLLLKKKKYAALIVEEKDGKTSVTMEKKGLDVVRRDWCNLSHDASEFVLNAIFSDQGRDEMLSSIHDYLAKLGEDVKKGEVSVDKFVINKGLTKNPEDYADVKNQPHVQVALQMKAKGSPFRVGDTVPYVIVVGEGTGLAGRAQHPDEVKATDSPFKVDYQYYLANQVLPPLSRLLSPIDGTDQSRIAACLGLDASKFHASTDASEMIEEKLFTLESTISEEERFKRCTRLNIFCPTCETSFQLQGLLRLETSAEGHHTFVSGLYCENPDCHARIPDGCINQQTLVAIRSAIRTYMSGCNVCDEKSCGARVRCVAVISRRCPVKSCKGVLAAEFTDSMLLTQLQYFKSLFSADSTIKRFEKNRKIDETQRNVLNVLARQAEIEAMPVILSIQRFINLNARGVVDLTKIWGSMGLITGANVL
ncbi:DNA-directed DNA polymerase [Chytriomyces confervae]|uniref:DNA polymerase n=1 Tax=Chytriomyces confervae TaxID=246404 RepID=A0A507FJJ7_9FUNG|nr:DNA-directed DNA polymerase [Chytriomyces confervae]